MRHVVMRHGLMRQYVVRHGVMRRGVMRCGVTCLSMPLRVSPSVSPSVMRCGLM